MQKPSKINQKSSKNGPKISLGGVSGGPWGLLAAKIEKRRLRCELLGPLGAILGPSWGPLGAVLALGSPSWAVLRRLGVVLGRLKFDWYRFGWIWSDGMHVHALPTSQLIRNKSLRRVRRVRRVRRAGRPAASWFSMVYDKL